MKLNPIRIKTFAIIGFIVLAIVALPLMPFFLMRVFFTSSFVLWGVTFYLKKIKPAGEIVTDGIWWVPYFLVTGLGVLTFTEEYRIILSVDSWIKLVHCSFLLIICAILFFWEWPPWLDSKKTLLGRGKRILIAYLFFIPGLVIWLYGGMCIINVAMDRSAPAAHNCLVTAKVILNHRNAADIQFLIFTKSWNDQRRLKSFAVSEQDFQHVNLNSTVIRVWTKPGFLHNEWVTGIKILTL